MWKRIKSMFNRSSNEPIFAMTHNQDPEMLAAYQTAAATVGLLTSFIRERSDCIHCVKLRLKDPGLSEKLGEDRFVFLWLGDVQFEEDGQLTARFFETPPELREWYRVGEHVRFRKEDIFDWFVNDQGLLYGGFTMRVQRARLPENERGSFDDYTGVREWMDPAIS